MKRLPYRVAAHGLAVGLFLLLGACASTQPPTQVRVTTPAAWQAPLPHQGTVTALGQWWQQQGDAVLVELIAAAQNVSPSVAEAATRMAQARTQGVLTGANVLPRLDAVGSGSRSVSQPPMNQPTTLVQGGLQASWELDVLNANRTLVDSAKAQAEGSRALWHDARVSVAAEVAQVYYALSACYQVHALLQSEATSQQESTRLLGLSADAGLVSRPQLALAQAALADVRSRVAQQDRQCKQSETALVALTGLEASVVRSKVSQSLAQAAQAKPFVVDTVPAQTLNQRPDLWAAQRDVAMASARVGTAQAARFPSLTLNGSVGRMRSTTDGVSTDLDTWSFGPLALRLPLFDGGVRVANIELAQARYEEAVTVYRAKVRQAVREVEDALNQQHSAQLRSTQAAAMVQSYTQSFTATQQRAQAGLASTLELEEARRALLAAQSAQQMRQWESNVAWVALYRALGGGFDPQAADAAVAATP